VQVVEEQLASDPTAHAMTVITEQPPPPAHAPAYARPSVLPVALQRAYDPTKWQPRDSALLVRQLVQHAPISAAGEKWAGQRRSKGSRSGGFDCFPGLLLGMAACLPGRLPARPAVPAAHLCECL